MKIEKLTDNKIRIIINIEELSKKNINLNNLIKNYDCTDSLLKTILMEAEKQVGFNVQNSKLLIEAFSTTEEYIIFTITKYKNEKRHINYRKNLNFKQKITNQISKNAIYKFSTFEEFCNFCVYCSKSKLNDLKSMAKNISLYEYKNFYYLVFFNININYENIGLFYISISEFSNLISKSNIFKSQLEEHGNVIFKTNAIKNGIKYFSKM